MSKDNDNFDNNKCNGNGNDNGNSKGNGHDYDPDMLRPNYKVISSVNEPVYSLITDGTYNLTMLDGAAIIMDFTHAETHDGNAYGVSKLFQDVVASGYADLHIMTGSDLVHMYANVTADGKSYITLHRGATYSNSGTAITVYNRNDSSLNTTDCSVYYSPTITDSGTLLCEDLLPGGTGVKTVGGESSKAERILNTSTDYLIRVRNESSVTGDVAIGLSYYELSH